MLVFPHHGDSPFAHQLEELEFSRNLPGRALWWEMGCAKSKPVIETMAHLAAAREIDTVLVLAPGNVADNWVHEELARHLHPSVAEVTRTMLWKTQKAQTGWHQELLKQLLAHNGLRFLAMTYDSLMTDAGAAAIKALKKGRRCMVIMDETSEVKTPGAKRTKRLLAMLKHPEFVYRRVLNGSLAYDSPMECYSQCRAARDAVWAERGIGNYQEFKNFFGVFERRTLQGGRQYPHLVSYQNLPVLNQVVASLGKRWRKADVLDLPEKLYEKRSFDLDPQARKHYDQIVDEYRTFLSGREIEADLSIVRMTRMRQIAAGYLPNENDEPTKLASGSNPRLSCLGDVLDQAGEQQAIIWCQYNYDVDQVAALLQSCGLTHGSYDGRTSEDDRPRILDDFRAGRLRYLIAKPSAAGRGITLTNCSLVIYYTNGFSLDLRCQSEDRVHRPGQKNKVTYVDIVARGTIDGYILQALRSKRAVAAIVNGDQLSAAS